MQAGGIGTAPVWPKEIESDAAETYIDLDR
jgi:hypothetical protein